MFMERFRHLVDLNETEFGSPKFTASLTISHPVFTWLYGFCSTNSVIRLCLCRWLHRKLGECETLALSICLAQKGKLHKYLKYITYVLSSSKE